MILDGDSKVNNAKIYRNSDHMELEKAYETIEWYQNKLKALKESMKPKPIDENTPKNVLILLKIEGQWLQGLYNSKYNSWEVAWLAYHGCGCCGESLSTPTHWLPLPEES